MRRPLVLALLLACSGAPLLDPDAGAPLGVTDAGHAVPNAADARDAVEAPGPADADSPEPDASSDEFDAGWGPDAGPLADAGRRESPPDAGPSGALDAGAEANVGVHGQCGTDSDCATGSCNPRPPGGFCLACTGDSSCGAGFTCSESGACNQDCEVDGDCPAGLRCHSTQFVCVLRPCGTACPAGTVCEGSSCTRPPCDASCPAGRCSGGYCIVDR
jgi:hypothetical protein